MFLIEIQMNTIYLLSIVFFFTGIGLLILRYVKLRESIAIWLYLLSAGLALYNVATGDKSQLIHLSAMAALFLAVIPAIIDDFAPTDKTLYTLKRKNFISISKKFSRSRQTAPDRTIPGS